MGVLQNGYRDKIGVFRTYGGTFHNSSFPQGTLGNYNLTGMKRNITAGEGITDLKAGLPMGYVMRGWQLPQKAGMISSRAAALSVTPTGSMLRGFPISGTAGLTIETNTPEGQLIVSGTGTATVVINTNAPLLTASVGGTGSAEFSITTNIPVLGAKASGSGAATISISTNVPVIFPLNDASPLREGSATITLTGTLTPYAIGQMNGTTDVTTELTAESISASVWNAILADFNENGTAGKALASAGSGGVDLEALAAAILAAAQVTPIHADVQKMNGATVYGTGVEADKWRGNV
jgi:hypothetical protein